jgi:hypothetical protein
MSVIRPTPPEDPIRYDPSAVFEAGSISRSAVESLAGRLETARAESLADLDRWRQGGATPGESLDPAFIDLPDRLLADYGTKRLESELFAILQTARRIREAVPGDRARYRWLVHGHAGAVRGLLSSVPQRAAPR